MTILDANDLADGTVLRAPVCIVGGGAAGITLALELDGLGVACLLLESGGREYEEETQVLYRGDAGDYFNLTTTRLRQLGGTTNHYGGQSRPLDPLDFEAQPWRGDVAWPISRDEALADLPAAVDYVGLVGDDWDVGSYFPDAAPPLDPDLEHRIFQQYIRPFDDAFADRLEASSLIEVVLHANVTQVRLAEGSPAVSHLEVRTLGGTQLRAEADAFVVATGGIESPRLLLASTADAPAGVGNSSGLVGRYFNDHPTVGPLPIVAGAAAPGPLAVQVEARPEENVLVVASLSPTEDAQRRLELPAFHGIVVLSEAPVADEDLAAGVERLIDVGRPVSEQVRSVAIGIEAVPNPDSRVTLDGTRNDVGDLQARLEWRLTDEDEETFRRAVLMVATELARQGVGRVDLSPLGERWIDQALGQHHHMGTLRMSASPTAGVVDGDLRFHDVPNLFAAGSAVFPTYGHANPTMNLVAMAVRLARTLAAEVGS